MHTPVSSKALSHICNDSQTLDPQYRLTLEIVYEAMESGRPFTLMEKKNRFEKRKEIAGAGRDNFKS